ncbi:MAG: molybdopterin cofactor-binding domain-containing protein [Gemmatimonadales bacterium]
MTATNVTRRDFVRAGIAAGAGLTLAIYLPGCGRPGAQAVATTPFKPNAWLNISTDGSVTVIVGRSEMGQGVLTSLPQMVAEELDADWSKVSYRQSGAGKEYANPAFGMQGTGGSTSVRASMQPLREAGAKARAMLIAAAAQDWGIDPSACGTEADYVVETGGNRRMSYGDLAEKAATQPVPEQVTLKDPKDFRLIGRPLKRLDVPAKVTGQAGFGIDAHVSGMLVAVVERPPVFGGTVKSYDAKDALAVPGVRHVVQIDSGVAVVADGYWPAMKGRKALKVDWDPGAMAGVSSADISVKFASRASKKGVVARHDGDATAALRRAASTVDAVYEVPYLAHATMEPMNCAASVEADKCTVWAPTQFQWGPNTGVKGLAAQIAGVPEEAVTVHTTMLGGGFGRRFELDFVVEALALSKAVAAPVKVVWSREDDVQHDFYRPATWNRLVAGLDGSGKPTAWSHKIVGPSIMTRFAPVFGPLPNGLDDSSVEGAANLPYGIPNIHCDWVQADVGVPVGFWRSVGSSQNAFITECFVDELAHAAGKDPFEFRRALLADAPRHRGVLELAAQKAGWGSALPAGRGRGIAVAESFGSYVAEVAEVSLENGKPRVHRVVCAIDCGMHVNPDIVAAQMESAIVYGLTAALYGQITIENGGAKQSNFDNYLMLRIDEMPVVEVHILPSTEPPGGVGEPGTPPIAPAVANALFQVTGQRIRKLPIVA